MNCIYNKKIPCELNPNGPRTKDFVCLKCHKPEKESKNESQANNQRIFNARGRFSSKRKGSGSGRGCGRGRGRR
jgi:hypothetical protein